jgi:tetratricopeptide (TPR) repeat protein
MGLNTGLVVLGPIGDNRRMHYTAIGDTTNLAARLQQIAEPGAILIGDATAQLVQDYVRTESLGPMQIRGRREMAVVHAALGLGRRRSPLDGLGERALSDFVGRAHELAVLYELLAKARAGQPQVVGLVGEPGMGKTRLLHEVRRSLAGVPITYLEGRCVSYGMTVPYLPIIDALRANCGIIEADSSQIIAEKVKSALTEVGVDPTEAAPYLLRLLGHDEGDGHLPTLGPEAIRRGTFETLRQMCLQGARRRPLIFVAEDLHWLDRSSEEFLASLVDCLNDVPILLLCTYRPGYQPPWRKKPLTTEIVLHPLAASESKLIVQSVLRTERVPEPLVETVIQKAEGNPFFLEELARSVSDDAVGEDTSSVAVPNTVQSVLMARIDRIPDEPRRALQAASILGREVPLQLLSHIWEGPGGVIPHLDELKRLEFLYERDERTGPVYVFAHALTQEVAYESLLTVRRQVLHQRVGRALEQLHDGRLEDVYDRLAFHYARSERSDKAIHYLSRVAEQAARGHAHFEAIAALRQALLHVDGLPAEVRDRRRVEVVLNLAFSLYFPGFWQERLELLLGVRDCVERVDDPTLSGRYYFLLGHSYNVLGDQQQASHIVRRAIDEAQHCGDRLTMGRAYHVLAHQMFWSGQLDQALEHGQRAISLLEASEERYWLGMSYWVVAITRYLLGQFDPALVSIALAHEFGEKVGDPQVRTFAAWTAALIHAARGSFDTAIEAARRGLDIAPDPVNVAISLSCLGFVELERGDATQATVLFEEAVAKVGPFRARSAQAWMTAHLAEAYYVSGQFERAHDVASQNLALAQEVQFPYAVGLVQRVLGCLAHASNDLADAARWLRAALNTFESSHMNFEVARTRLDLARLELDRGERFTADAELASARSLFGALGSSRYVARVDDLRAARALL